MSEQFKLNATARTETGTQHSRQLRKSGQVPAIVYGAHTAPQMITLNHQDVFLSLQKPGFTSHVVQLSIDGQAPLQTIIKNYTKHSTKNQVLHLDFQAVNAKESMIISVPLHFIGEAHCAAIQDQGGQLNILTSTLEIRCLPQNIPESIAVDISHLEMDSTVHLSDVTLPSKVECVATIDETHNPALASIHLAKAAPDIEAEEPTTQETSASEDNVAT
ncbi:MAG: 50S ribosomal protein L25/general stress protein Ctc [Legionellales bacterium]|nr:50S ribosomal protein L25/general stress protein Ctc [Legionellales bacterium]